MKYLLEDIEVFRLAENLADIIWHAVKKWHYFDRETVGKQIVRAADSISANIAESHGRYHYKDKQQFGYYARGSFEETKCWLRKCQRRKLLYVDQIEEISVILLKLGPGLNALINTYKHPRR